MARSIAIDDEAQDIEKSRSQDSKSIKWAKKIKEKDSFCCRICGKSYFLHSHHINSYDIFVDQRYDLNNGVTLCKFHHEIFHNIYGRGNNNKYQFKEYIKVLEIIDKLVRKKV